MMKAFLALCLAGLMVSCSAGPVMEMLIARVKACQDKVGATADDLAEFSDRTKSPVAEGAKKMMVCMMKEDKVIVDGKFSAEGALETMRKFTDGKPDLEKKVDLAKPILEECAAEIDAKAPTSEEDLAVNIRSCLMKNLKEGGFDMHSALD